MPYDILMAIKKCLSCFEINLYMWHEIKEGNFQGCYPTIEADLNRQVIDIVTSYQLMP